MWLNPELKRIAFALTATLALTQCAQSPVSGGKDVLPMSGKQEIQQSAQAHEEVLAQYDMVNNPALQAYVTRVGKALAANSHRPDLDWQFTVLDSAEVNAFALPGGYVHITRGILAYLNSEAELAGVLSHEIGHIAARHALHQQSASATTGLAAILDAILLPGMNNEAGATMLHSLATLWTNGYGRNNELEADRLGAEYLAKTRYNPQALVEVIGILKNQELFDAEQAKREDREPNHYHGTFATLPDNDIRLKQVVGEAVKYKGASPRQNKDEFLRVMNGVYFGDSPARGVFRNNALLHSRLGIALQFPLDWKVQSERDGADAINFQQDAMMRLLLGPNYDKPLDTLRRGLKLDAGARYESGSVNGYPAGFAAGAHQGKPVLAAAINYNGSQYLLAGITKDGPSYQRNKEAIKNAISSFHAMTPSERQQARPFVIRIITAQHGMTMAGLAAHSPLGPRAESYLRLMNHLYPDGEPSPGQLLKVVN
jgi:predicted Zn-dependent protease